MNIGGAKAYSGFTQGRIQPPKHVSPPTDVFVVNKSVHLPKEDGKVKQLAVVDWAGSSFVIGMRAPVGGDNNLNSTNGDALARFVDSSLIDHVEPVGE